MARKTKDEEGVVFGLSYRERREDIKKLIREIGLWRFPIQRRLAERYGVSQQQISKDLKHIFTTLDPFKVEEIFKEFYFAYQKIQIEMRNYLRTGTFDQKVRASMVILQLQKAFTDLLERYGKKKKDMQDPADKGIRIEIIEPESLKRAREGNDYDDSLEKMYEEHHRRNKREVEDKDLKKDNTKVTTKR